MITDQARSNEAASQTPEARFQSMSKLEAEANAKDKGSHEGSANVWMTLKKAVGNTKAWPATLPNWHSPDAK